jgi:hypothetical protein
MVLVMLFTIAWVGIGASASFPKMMISQVFMLVPQVSVLQRNRSYIEAVTLDINSYVQVFMMNIPILFYQKVLLTAFLVI